MKIWNVGDKAKHCAVKCTVAAINVHSAAIQYSSTGEIEIVPPVELRPDFSEEDQKAIEEMTKFIYLEDEYRNAAEALYLAGYRKKEKDVAEDTPEDMNDPANWQAGDWVECIYKQDSCITLGRVYQLIKIRRTSIHICIEDDDGDLNTYLPENFKFYKAGEQK